jgi:CCR4-NOT transcriptional regulation complex NOT5 subunit
MSMENGNNDNDIVDNIGDDDITGNDDDLYDDINDVKLPFSITSDAHSNIPSDTNNINVTSTKHTIIKCETDCDESTSANDVSNQVRPTYDFLSSSQTTSVIQLLPKNSLEQVPILQQQIQQLNHENKILKRNIGILYRTAMTEIQRKDQQIQELINSNKK